MAIVSLISSVKLEFSAEVLSMLCDDVWPVFV